MSLPSPWKRVTTTKQPFLFLTWTCQSREITQQTDCLRRSEVLRSLRYCLWAQFQGHHTINGLEERGMERGSARQSSSKGQERAIINQTNVRTVWKVTLGKLLKFLRQGGANMGFSKHTDTILNWTEPIFQPTNSLFSPFLLRSEWPLCSEYFQ